MRQQQIQMIWRFGFDGRFLAQQWVKFGTHFDIYIKRICVSLFAGGSIYLIFFVNHNATKIE